MLYGETRNSWSVDVNFMVIAVVFENPTVEEIPRYSQIPEKMDIQMFKQRSVSVIIK